MSYLVFPHQLYQHNRYIAAAAAAKRAETIYLVEEPRYFTDFKFHKLKLAYHRATMKRYEQHLVKDMRIDPKKIKYIEFKDVTDAFYKSKIAKPVRYIKPVDHKLEDKLETLLGKADRQFEEDKFVLSGSGSSSSSSSGGAMKRKADSADDAGGPAMKKMKGADGSSSAASGKASNHVMLDNLTHLVSFAEIAELKKSGAIFKNNRYSHDEFYKLQRKKLDLLMAKDGKNPEGGKWSFDEMNRLPLPKDIKIPDVNHKAAATTGTSTSNKSILAEAKAYAEKHFKGNYGTLENIEMYPIDHGSSVVWLNKFLSERLDKFGPYEDAVTDDKKKPFVFHSVLTPMMNVGILTDAEVVKASDAYYRKNMKKIPIASYEGFIRQVIGWRNYVYTVYIMDGRKQAASNFFKFSRKLDKKKWWEGTTGILPIDHIIKEKIVPFAYMHHIERLMYLGNWLLLCQIHPTEVHRIFMEWSIDSYDWVMVPNVYGMTQHADGGLMMTRPYFSSSNYIEKMSSFKKNSKALDAYEKANGGSSSSSGAGGKTSKQNDNDKWWEIFDAVYYNFINDHQAYLRKNYAIARQVKHWDNKGAAEKKKLVDTAKAFLKTI